MYYTIYGKKVFQPEELEMAVKKLAMQSELNAVKWEK